MDDVEAGVAGARDPHHRVEVRAVVVGGRADVVDDPHDLLDVRVEQPERVRVGQHQAGDVAVGLRPQVVDVDAAARVGADLDDLVAGHRHGRRVGAVGGVGRQHGAALLAAVGVVGARQRGRRRARRASRPRAAARRAAGPAISASARSRRHISSSAPCARAGSVSGCRRACPGERRDALVQARVVLHRARAERVEARVEVEVAPREAHVVAHELGLGDLRQPRRLAAAQPRRDAARRAGARARRAAAARTRAGPAAPRLEDRARALALHRRLARSCRRSPCGAAHRALGGERAAEHRRRAGRCPRASAAR